MSQLFQQKQILFKVNFVQFSMKLSLINLINFFSYSFAKKKSNLLFVYMHLKIYMLRYLHD